jgi:hypothetical protein
VNEEAVRSTNSQWHEWVPAQDPSNHAKHTMTADQENNHLNNEKRTPKPRSSSQNPLPTNRIQRKHSPDSAKRAEFSRFFDRWREQLVGKARNINGVE